MKIAKHETLPDQAFEDHLGQRALYFNCAY
jgi:hypothetical protein